jgi:hypothetical protein
MVVQGVLTVVAEIVPERVEALEKLLAALDASLDGDGGPPLVDFRVVDSVHFARFVVLPKNAAGKQHLAFSIAYDGPRQRHLGELLRLVGPGLVELYSHCVGAPSVGELTAYFDAHSVPYGAMHVGYVGRTVADIRSEEALRRFVNRVLDARKIATLPVAGRPAQSIRREVIELVARSDFRWALEPRGCPTAPSGVENWWKPPAVAATLALLFVAAGVVAFAAGELVLFLFVVAALTLALVGLLRYREIHDPAKTDTDVAQGLANAEDEDFGITNQLTHIAPIKPGVFRSMLLRTVLFAVDLRARMEFYQGALGGLETIHCAHWAILHEEQPRLLFFSNYDGSWERYLGDFIEEAGAGMTAVWSNTVNYPTSEFLLGAGAKNERVFKAWTRENQVRTAVWYHATAEISCRNLNDNSRLRDGLRGYMSEADARDWLRLL